MSHYVDAGQETRQELTTVMWLIITALMFRATGCPWWDIITVYNIRIVEHKGKDCSDQKFHFLHSYQVQRYTTIGFLDVVLLQGQNCYQTGILSVSTQGYLTWKRGGSIPENIWLFPVEWLHIAGDITWDSPESSVQWLQCAWVIEVPPCWPLHARNPGLASIFQPQGAATSIWPEQKRTWLSWMKDKTAVCSSHTVRKKEHGYLVGSCTGPTILTQSINSASESGWLTCVPLPRSKATVHFSAGIH